MTAEVVDALSAVHAGGMTIVTVAHDPAAVRGDRVEPLRDGLIIDERELGAWSGRLRTLGL